MPSRRRRIRTVATEDEDGAAPEEKLTQSIWRPFLPRQRTGKDKRGIFGRRQPKG